MTAEIAIVNRTAIALAADSALTVGGRRVHKSTSKLFSLGPVNDIAVMVYGNGLFCGQQWDSIVKTFRRRNGDQKFATVSECSAALIAYLASDVFRIESDDEMHLMSYGDYLMEPIEWLSKKIPSDLSKREYFTRLRGVMASKLRETEDANDLPGFMPKRDFTKKFAEFVQESAEDILAYNPSKALVGELLTFIHSMMSRENKTLHHSGIVVAGFGHDEYFASVCHHIVDGKGDFGFRNWLENAHDSNDAATSKTVILPFAQSDIFHLFMEGVSPDQVGFLEETLRRVLNAKSDELVKTHVTDPAAVLVERSKEKRENKAALDTFMKEFRRYRRENVVQPILDVVEHLPAQDLADMALAMVELTGLRRKVDSSIETVGGPIDVAVITKGDGLVWLQRKSYFDKALNPDFAHRKFGHLLGGLT